MSLDFIRAFCLSLPHATEEVQWEDHLLFKVGGRMFAITSLTPEGNRLSLKSTQEKFYELTEIDGVVPAPYMARNFWIALERWDCLRRTEIEDLVRESYALVFAKLSKKKQVELSSAPSRENKKKTKKKNGRRSPPTGKR